MMGDGQTVIAERSTDRVGTPVALGHAWSSPAWAMRRILRERGGRYRKVRMSPKESSIMKPVVPGTPATPQNSRFSDLYCVSQQSR